MPGGEHGALPPMVVPTTPCQVAVPRAVTRVSRSPRSTPGRSPCPGEEESGLQAPASRGPVAAGDSEPPSPSAPGSAVTLRPRSGPSRSPPGRGGPPSPLGPSTSRGSVCRSLAGPRGRTRVPWALGMGKLCGERGPSLSPQTLLCSQNSWLPGPKIKNTAPGCCNSSPPPLALPQHSAPSSSTSQCHPLAPCDRAAGVWNVPWFIIT